MYFGFSSLRPLQKQVIDAFLNGRDVFVRASTGSGKSLCYQLPPLLLNKVTVVVSPLISLMEDQVKSLQQANVKACALSSSCTDSKIWAGAANGDYALIYMSPERLDRWKPNLQDLVKGGKVCLFAIDEAHCISEWGHDFRNAYRDLHQLRQYFPSVPIMALTATATARVQADVIRSLHLRRPLIASTGMDRANLHYSIRPKNCLELDLSPSLFRAAEGGSVIIYCLSRHQTYEVSNILRSRGLKARAYHGNLSASERTKVHRMFCFDEIQIVVATIAFGMGIDKPDIRMVIHYGMPKTLEAYVQQTGRAGRDGQPSRCVLFWSNGDLGMSNFYTKDVSTAAGLRDFRSRSAAMEALAKCGSCRRAALLKYFGEKYELSNCGRCDNCDAENEALRAKEEGRRVPGSIDITRDFTTEARWFAKALRDTRERFGGAVLVSILKGSKAKLFMGKVHMFRRKNLAELESYGAMKSSDAKYLKELIAPLQEAKVIEAHYVGAKQHRVFKLGPEGHRLLRNPESSLLPIRVPPHLKRFLRVIDSSSITASRTEASKPYGISSNLQRLQGHERALYDKLVELRAKMAGTRGIAPYMIFNGTTLQEMAKRRPTRRAALAAISGVSLQKMQTYGTEFAHCIVQYASEHDLRTDLDEDLANSTRDEVPPFRPKIGAKQTSNPSRVLTRRCSNDTPAVSIDLNSLNKFSHGKQSPIHTDHRVIHRSPIRRRQLSSNAKKVWQMFQGEKQSLSQISSSSLIRKSKAEESLAEAIELGYEVDWERLRIPIHVEKRIRQVLEALPMDLPEHGKASALARVKEAVDEEVSFAQIRFVIAKVSNEATSPNQTSALSQGETLPTRESQGQPTPYVPKQKMKHSYDIQFTRGSFGDGNIFQIRQLKTKKRPRLPSVQKSSDERSTSISESSPNFNGSGTTSDNLTKIFSSKRLKRPLPSEALEVWEMYQVLKVPIDAIMKSKMFSRPQIENYLGRCLENGKDVDWERLGIPNSVYNTIQDAVRRLMKELSDTALPPLSEIKDILPDDISYSQIRLVRACLGKRGFIPPSFSSSHAGPQNPHLMVVDEDELHKQEQITPAKIERGTIPKDVNTFASSSSGSPQNSKNTSESKKSVHSNGYQAELSRVRVPPSGPYTKADAILEDDDDLWSDDSTAMQNLKDKKAAPNVGEVSEIRILDEIRDAGKQGLNLESLGKKIFSHNTNEDDEKKLLFRQKLDSLRESFQIFVNEEGNFCLM